MEHDSECASATWGTPVSSVCVFDADVETLAASPDWDANPGLPAGEAGLRSEAAETEDEATDANLESAGTDALTDSQFCWSAMLKRFSWTSGTDESGVSLVESSGLSFK